jgi:RHS repeat-associated protein
MTVNGVTTYFTNGPDGEVVSERIPSGSTYNAYYYLYDGLGSVVALTDSTGNIVNSYAYDPYGNTTSVSEQVANPFRFTGAIWDSSTGLYKMGERYYDSTVGQFTQPDPIGSCAGSSSSYSYGADNPANETDPSGLVLVGPGGGSQAHKKKKRRGPGKKHPSKKRPGKKRPTPRPRPTPTPRPGHGGFAICFLRCLGVPLSTGASCLEPCLACGRTRGINIPACVTCALCLGKSIDEVIRCYGDCS